MPKQKNTTKVTKAKEASTKPPAKPGNDKATVTAKKGPTGKAAKDTQSKSTTTANTVKVTKATPATTDVSPKAKTAPTKPPARSGKDKATVTAKKGPTGKAAKDAQSKSPTKANTVTTPEPNKTDEGRKEPFVKKLPEAISAGALQGVKEATANIVVDDVEAGLKGALTVVKNAASDWTDMLTVLAGEVLNHPFTAGVLERLSFMSVHTGTAAAETNSKHDELMRLKDMLERRSKLMKVLKAFGEKATELIATHDQLADDEQRAELVQEVINALVKALESDKDNFEQVLRSTLGNGHLLLRITAGENGKVRKA